MSKSKALDLLQREYTQTEGFGKLILIGMFVNIPIDGFIPYFSQVATVIILAIFLKKYLLLIQDKESQKNTSNLPFTYGSKIVIGFTILIMLVQLVWVPFMTELVTLVLLGILYAIFTTYKK